MYQALHVAPRRGAWIEILLYFTGRITVNVAPRRGAWIEIDYIIS